jgi:hypothetical protein
MISIVPEERFVNVIVSVGEFGKSLRFVLHFDESGARASFAIAENGIFGTGILFF